MFARAQAKAVLDAVSTWTFLPETIRVRGCHDEIGRTIGPASIAEHLARFVTPDCDVETAGDRRE